MMIESRNLRDVYSILVGKFERKKPLWRPIRRWGDNIKKTISSELVSFSVR
jgi:hypothetical protein